MSHDWDAAVVTEGVVCCGEIIEIQRNVDRQHRHNTMQTDANFSCYYVNISVLKLLIFSGYFSIAIFRSMFYLFCKQTREKKGNV